MLFVGYFEGIDPPRGIAWRCADSLAIRTFLGYSVTEKTPLHVSMTIIRKRLSAEVFTEVFRFVLGVLHEYRLSRGKTIGINATTLEANTAIKTIVRKDTAKIGTSICENCWRRIASSLSTRFSLRTSK